MEPPSIPASVPSWPVQKGDGSATRVVTQRGAATLMGLKPRQIRAWVGAGKLETCIGSGHQTLILVDSLWAIVPEEFKRA